MISRLVVLMALAAAGSSHAAEPLVVVDDIGGASALPNYRALNLQSSSTVDPPTHPTIPAPPSKRFSEADLLPVRSMTLKPGTIVPRVVQLPGFRPLFIVGDDHHSRAWLKVRLDELLALDAIGVVTQVESKEALDEIRRLAPGLTLVPASADDLAQRLHISSYPVLITPTGIEQ